MENLAALTEEALTLVAEAQDMAALDHVRVEYLGKKGQITALLKTLGKLSAEERPAAGAEINKAKQQVQEKITAVKEGFEKAAIEAKLASETIDVTLSGRGQTNGGLHPVTRTLQRIEEIFYAPHESNRDALKTDQRIHHVIQRLRATASENVSVKELAKEVEMSESGLIKLFRKQVGAPIRKHRLWYRLMNFVILIMAGKSTAEAIPLAGFSDASHLSKSYSSLMGIPISIAFSQPPKIKCIVSDSALDAASKLPPETMPVDVYD